MRTAMILAAGLGTRLRPLTDELPKPLVPIGDVPAIEHVVRALAKSGVERVVVNVHHLASAFAGVVLSLPATFVEERAILGTAGGVANVRGEFDDGAIVWNGDVLAGVDVEALEFARTSTSAIAALAMAPRPRGEGTVGVGDDGRLVRLRRTTYGEETRGGDFLGISSLSRDVVEALPREGCLVGDVLVPALARGARIATMTYEGEWIDVGSRAAYLEANMRWLRGNGRESWIGAGAIADPKQVHGSIVGAGATVAREALLEEVVVWPGARVVAPARRAVITTAGRVVTVE